ncbi:ankyrin repeat domain-containing protein [Aliiroseovarius sp. YM-037]|uniref:ankyrin repeat domain-containing protein n=1 Tax=Aliiroseovarius sp. YM-037 TaxID=3341728 RepID=UPI003A7FC166
MPDLPARPSIENLKKHAKRLVKSAQAKDPRALALIGPYFGDSSKISLQQAHLVLARAYGFSSWSKLTRHVEARSWGDETREQRANRFLDLACIHYAPDPNNRSAAEFQQAAALLEAYPDIAEYSLHTAAASGDLSKLKELLSKHPDQVERKGGPFGWTPLMYAAYARLPKVSTLNVGKALIEAGADPNAHFMSYGTYRFSVLTGVLGDGEGGLVRQPPHPDMVPFARALLDAGANPNDSQGAYNRCFSPDNTHLELMLEYGLKDSDPSDWWLADAKNDPQDHRTMHFQLIIALRWGFADRARLLIEHGVDISSPDNYYATYTVGYTPYQVALMRGMPEIAALVKAKGGHAKPLGGYETFQAACMGGDYETASELAPKHMGQDRDKDQELLCEAAGNGNLAAVQTMIKLGFELSPRGKRTALHASAFKGHIDVVRALIDAGADTSIRDPDYHTPPFVHAMHNFQEETAQILSTCPMDIFAAAATGNLEQLITMLDNNPSLANARFSTVRTGPQNGFERDWATPLWYAAINGNVDVVQLLLARGADPNIGDSEGRTIKDHAIDAGQKEVVELLNQF